MASALPIFSRVNEAGAAFISLERALRDSARFAAQVRPQHIADEFDRFKIWAGNMAAHRKGRRSLEYRLRDAAHLKEELNKLLAALQDSIQTSLAIVEGNRVPWDELSDSDSDSGSDAELSDHTEGDTELKQLLGSIKTAITCLFRLSMSIRNPAPNDQSRSIITVDKSYFKEYDMQHAKAKFPSCADYLVERLGCASSGRRQYLSYREEHHQKLAKDVDLVGLEAPKTEHTSNSTEATSMPTARANSFDVLDGDDALSQTSYATSVNAAIRVPPLPKVAHEQEHFECPICFMIVSIHTVAGWKQHVYRDLHCYCCTFENCITADHLYDSRHAWFTHELEAHRTSWQCIEGCGETFSTEEKFENHIRTSHPDLGHPRMLSALKRTSAKKPSLSDEAHCPLCDQRMTLRLLQRHAARHQEQFALFALPPNLEATEDEPQDDEHQSVDMNEWQDEELSDVSDTVDAEDLADVNNPTDGDFSDASDDEDASVSRTDPQDINTSRSAIGSVPTNQWFVPGDGIDEEVIDADIQRYLGPDALVRPGFGTDEYEGRAGYWITAYRTLTAQMIQDLKTDSQRWQNERDGKSKGASQDSSTHSTPDEEVVEYESDNMEVEETPALSRKLSKKEKKKAKQAAFAWDEPEAAPGPNERKIGQDVDVAFGVRTSAVDESFADANRAPTSDAGAETNHTTRSSIYSLIEESDKYKNIQSQPKGILRRPAERFPEDPEPIREGHDPYRPPTPPSPSATASPSGPPKSILRKPTEEFPEDPFPIREGVAPLNDASKDDDSIPPEARWTKIDRRLVNPEALEEAKERFEERLDCVIVLRVLRREEIQKLADRTKEIREGREAGKRDQEVASSKGKEAAVDAESVSGDELTFSYTDPAGMYRDTEPAWRRPLSGNIGDDKDSLVDRLGRPSHTDSTGFSSTNDPSRDVQRGALAVKDAQSDTHNILRDRQQQMKTEQAPETESGLRSGEVPDGTAKAAMFSFLSDPAREDLMSNAARLQIELENTPNGTRGTMKYERTRKQYELAELELRLYDIEAFSTRAQANHTIANLQLQISNLKRDLLKYPGKREDGQDIKT